MKPRETWDQTLYGGKFDLTAPEASAVDFAEVARVLARTPRFGGHTQGGVYSVAQHCAEGARSLQREARLQRHVAMGDGWKFRAAAVAFLLHDAHEAYIGDIATPVASALAWWAVKHLDSAFSPLPHLRRPEIGGEIVKQALHDLKAALDSAIYTAAGITWPLDPRVAAIVKEYDIRMCRTERDARMATPPEPWVTSIEAAIPIDGCDLSVWSEDEAFGAWLDMARDMLPRGFADLPSVTDHDRHAAAAVEGRSLSHWGLFPSETC